MRAHQLDPPAPALRSPIEFSTVLRETVQSLQMEEQEVEVTEAEVLQLLQQAALHPSGFEAHAKAAGGRASS